MSGWAEGTAKVGKRESRNSQELPSVSEWSLDSLPSFAPSETFPNSSGVLPSSFKLSLTLELPELKATRNIVARRRGAHTLRKKGGSLVISLLGA